MKNGKYTERIANSTYTGNGFQRMGNFWKMDLYPRKSQRIIFIIHVSCVSCFLVCSLQPCGNLQGKGEPLGSPVCDVFLCFCHFPMRCPGSGVVHVLDCIDSRSLPSYLLERGLLNTLFDIFFSAWPRWTGPHNKTNSFFIRSFLTNLFPILWEAMSSSSISLSISSVYCSTQVTYYTATSYEFLAFMGLRDRYKTLAMIYLRGWKFQISKILNFRNSNHLNLQENCKKELSITHVISSLNDWLCFDNLNFYRRSYYNLPNSAFWGLLSMESQPQNPEFWIIYENFHPCIWDSDLY